MNPFVEMSGGDQQFVLLTTLFGSIWGPFIAAECFYGASRCDIGNAVDRDSFFFIDEGKLLFDEVIGKTRNTAARRLRSQESALDRKYVTVVDLSQFGLIPSKLHFFRAIDQTDSAFRSFSRDCRTFVIHSSKRCTVTNPFS
jgi:hypothetical protein